jgi:AAA15 family ATPase/GTPase
MESIRIQGLRSLKDTGEIKLAPLTILLGENSAGKSTFLRTFPLLKQSLSSNTRGAILWYGTYVDFGDFDQALSRYSYEEIMSFTFGINLDISYDKNSHYDYIINSMLPHYREKYNLSVDLKKDKKNSVRVFSFSIKIGSIDVTVTINQNKNKIDSIKINDSDYSSLFQDSDIKRVLGNKLVPLFIFESDFEKYSRNISIPQVFINESILQKLEEILAPFTRKGTKVSNIVDKVTKCDCSSPENFFRTLKSSSSTKTWLMKIDEIKNNSEILEEIRNLVFAFNLPNLIYILNEYMEGYCRDINYIAPMRATAERYYRTQNLNVEQVDHQGNNLPMFIDNLSEVQKKSFKDWMEANFGFHLDAVSTTGHLSLFIHYSGSDKDYNVTDMGFGFSQLLPIITQLWFSSSHSELDIRRFNMNSEKTLLIEQPELHLHPRMQARLIDTFAKTIKLIEKEKFNLKIIIETHSETIVNYVGRCILRDEISKDDTSIVIFDKDSPSSPTKVGVSTYDEDGCLIDWPWGFFDTE